MTDAGAAFVRGIAEAGDDFTPRLVFADWLDEQGEHDRAAFVRDGVLVAVTPTDTPERREAARRAFERQRRFGKRWAGPVARHAHDWQFRAGFPDMVGLTAAKLRRNAKALFAHTPICSLLVTGLAGRVDTLGAIPPDNGVTRLSLWGARLTAAHLERLAVLPNLPRLRTLSLLFNGLDAAAVPLLTADPLFARLDRLELGANPFTDAARDDLRAALGDRVSFECEREDDTVYTIQNDDPFYNGVGPDGTQYCTRDGANGVEIARFDRAGNLLGVETRRYGDPADDPDVSLLEGWGVQDADVCVKRFAHADGRGIRGLPTLDGLFESPASRTAEDVEFAHQVLEHWLHEGEFAYGNCILNRAGEVTAT